MERGRCTMSTCSKDVSLGEARRELAEMGLDPSLAFEFEDDDGEAPVPIEKGFASSKCCVATTSHRWSILVRGEGFEPSNP